MICNNCGNYVEDGAAFCNYCGASMNNQQQGNVCNVYNGLQGYDYNGYVQDSNQNYDPNGYYGNEYYDYGQYNGNDYNGSYIQNDYLIGNAVPIKKKKKILPKIIVVAAVICVVAAAFLFINGKGWKAMANKYAEAIANSDKEKIMNSYYPGELKYLEENWGTTKKELAEYFKDTYNTLSDNDKELYYEIIGDESVCGSELLSLKDTASTMGISNLNEAKKVTIKLMAGKNKKSRSYDESEFTLTLVKIDGQWYAWE